MAINIFFACYFALVCLNVVALSIYCCCNEACQCWRWISHVSWCIIALLMLLTFLLGGILGAFGLLFTDGSGFLEYLFSEQNLKFDQVILSGQMASYINTCFNGKK